MDFREMFFFLDKRKERLLYFLLKLNNIFLLKKIFYPTNLRLFNYQNFHLYLHVLQLGLSILTCNPTYPLKLFDLDWNLPDLSLVTAGGRFPFSKTESRGPTGGSSHKNRNLIGLLLSLDTNPARFQRDSPIFG